jgi:hypothetical protein
VDFSLKVFSFKYRFFFFANYLVILAVSVCLQDQEGCSWQSFLVSYEMNMAGMSHELVVCLRNA